MHLAETLNEVPAIIFVCGPVGYPPNARWRSLCGRRSTRRHRIYIGGAFDRAGRDLPHVYGELRELLEISKENATSRSPRVTTPNVTVRYGCALIDFAQYPRGVNVTARAADGSAQMLRAELSGRMRIGPVASLFAFDAGASVSANA
jgi:hypothetical protein